MPYPISVCQQTLGGDFVPDQLAMGKKLRVRTVVDIFSKFSLVVDPRFSYRVEDVIRTLEKICVEVDYLKTICVDQGGEFVSRDLWAYANGVTLNFSRAGKPTDKALIFRPAGDCMQSPSGKAFNSKVHSECLDTHWLMSFDDAHSNLDD